MLEGIKFNNFQRTSCSQAWKDLSNAISNILIKGHLTLLLEFLYKESNDEIKSQSFF